VIFFHSPSSPPTYYPRFSFDSDFVLEGLAVHTSGRRILAFLSAVQELVRLSPGVGARIGRVLPGDLAGVVVCRRCSVVQRVRHFYQRRFFVNFPHPGLRFGLPATTGSSPSPIHSTTANTTYRALPIPLVLPPLAFATFLPRFRRIGSVSIPPGSLAAKAYFCDIAVRFNGPVLASPRCVQSASSSPVPQLSGRVPLAVRLVIDNRVRSELVETRSVPSSMDQTDPRCRDGPSHLLFLGVITAGGVD
jgi:hypothetical protein